MHRLRASFKIPLKRDKNLSHSAYCPDTPAKCEAINHSFRLDVCFLLHLSRPSIRIIASCFIPIYFVAFMLHAGCVGSHEGPAFSPDGRTHDCTEPRRPAARPPGCAFRSEELHPASWTRAHSSSWRWANFVQGWSSTTVWRACEYHTCGFGLGAGFQGRIQGDLDMWGFCT